MDGVIGSEDGPGVGALVTHIQSQVLCFPNSRQRIALRLGAAIASFPSITNSAWWLDAGFEGSNEYQLTPSV